MIELEAKTLPEAFERTISLVDQLKTSDDPNPYCWFRGAADSNHKLLPGAYWRENYEEQGPLVQFSQEGPAYANVGIKNDWDTYYLAQHYGIPTRLLDWTESFSAALFFAIDGWNGSSEPCVWVMRPAALNQLSLQWFGVIAPNNFRQELDLWLPDAISRSASSSIDSGGFKYENTKPLAIYPRRSNNRIVAQQGTFTVHGKENVSLEDYVSRESKSPEDCLGRLILRGAALENVRFQLGLLGVTRPSIFPDIQNFVSHLKYMHGWQ